MSKPSIASWKTKIKAELSKTRGLVICPFSAPSFGPNSTGQRMGRSVQEGTIVNPGVFKEQVLLLLEAERVPLCDICGLHQKIKLGLEIGTKET